MSDLAIIMMVIWGATIIIAVLVEMYTCEIISIWFAPGGIVALVLAPFDVHPAIQVVVFLAVAALGFFAFRPLAKKCLIKPTEDIHITKTQIGNEVRLTEDSVDGKSTILINDVEWRARIKCNQSDEHYTNLSKDTLVKIVAFEGNKVVVEEVV